MKTEKHPFSKVIHYGVGGFIDHVHNKAEFRTLCGRKFKQGHSELMQSGYVGAQNVTCKNCKRKLKKQEKRKEALEKYDRKCQIGRTKLLAKF